MEKTSSDIIKRDDQKEAEGNDDESYSSASMRQYNQNSEEEKKEYDPDYKKDSDPIDMLTGSFEVKAHSKLNLTFDKKMPNELNEVKVTDSYVKSKMTHIDSSSQNTHEIENAI